MIRWQAVFLISIALLSLNCGTGTDKNMEYNSTDPGIDKAGVLHADARDTALHAVQPETLPDCPWLRYATEHHIPKVASRLIERNELDLNGEYGEPLDLLDSMLRGASAESRSFYMWLVTRTMPKADGYYSEGLGNMARDYAENHTTEWISNLNNTSCFGQEDVRGWADAIANELLIVDENADQGVLDTCIARLNKSCEKCGAGERQWLDHFNRELRAEHQRFLQGYERMR